MVTFYKRTIFSTLILTAPLACLPLAAQFPQQTVNTAPAAAPKSDPSNISNKPPDIPVDQIVQPDGEYRMTSDILFTPEGKRYEKVVSAPPPTLQRISLSQQDLDDLEHVQPFVLTSDELPKYDVNYVGRENLDELSTYVFDVKPKKIEKNQRYFQGRIWVDDRDLNIVKSDGKAVPDIIKRGNENIFPRFETFRENIEGHYWFPTYTRSDDELHFSTGAIHMRMTVRYANYKRFGASIKIGPATETKDPDKDKPKN
jgi:hypothetical protein